MKICITGCRGFLGSAILSYLSDKGHNIHGLTTNICDKEALRPFFKDAKLIIHAAGKVKDVYNRKINYEINVLGTMNVVELCIEYGCKLIHLSSITRYTPYGRSKQESQRLVEENSNNGLKVIILRLCPIITMESKISVEHRYYLDDLMVDIEDIVKNHDFSKYKLINYKR